eukprot:TRINITY_DN31622_c0_g1_i1.p1 TRINITY_DN31622_c0_g1~~TRINITY_DN31622_c0_g1_i1.p1  ORF type:complete len:932 (+),score=170.54 TRINITY_DN31622_c0_g1_i1:86-2797(+)
MAGHAAQLRSLLVRLEGSRAGQDQGAIHRALVSLGQRWPSNAGSAAGDEEDLFSRLARLLAKRSEEQQIEIVAAFRPLREEIARRLATIARDLNDWLSGAPLNEEATPLRLAECFQVIDHAPEVRLYKYCRDLDLKTRFLMAVASTIRAVMDPALLKNYVGSYPVVQVLAQRLQSRLFTVPGRGVVLTNWLDARLERYNSTWQRVADRVLELRRDEAKSRLASVLRPPSHPGGEAPRVQMSRWPMAHCPLAREFHALVSAHASQLGEGLRPTLEECTVLSLRPAVLIRFLRQLGGTFDVGEGVAGAPASVRLGPDLLRTTTSNAKAQGWQHESAVPPPPVVPPPLADNGGAPAFPQMVPPPGLPPDAQALDTTPADSQAPGIAEAGASAEAAAAGMHASETDVAVGQSGIMEPGPSLTGDAPDVPSSPTPPAPATLAEQNTMASPASPEGMAHAAPSSPVPEAQTKLEASTEPAVPAEPARMPKLGRSFGGLAVGRKGAGASASSALGFDLPAAKIPRKGPLDAEAPTSGNAATSSGATIRRRFNWEDLPFLERLVRRGVRAEDTEWVTTWREHCEQEAISCELQAPKTETDGRLNKAAKAYKTSLTKFVERNLHTLLQKAWAKDLLYRQENEDDAPPPSPKPALQPDPPEPPALAATAEAQPASTAAAAAQAAASAVSAAQAAPTPAAIATPAASAPTAGAATSSIAQEAVLQREATLAEQRAKKRPRPADPPPSGLPRGAGIPAPLPPVPPGPPLFPNLGAATMMSHMMGMNPMAMMTGMPPPGMGMMPPPGMMPMFPGAGGMPVLSGGGGYGKKEKDKKTKKEKTKDKKEKKAAKAAKESESDQEPERAFPQHIPEKRDPRVHSTASLGSGKAKTKDAKEAKEGKKSAKKKEARIDDFDL